ncbi:unnamed protein product [Penicillium salamii]|nr:unnamed protein product [Penicillium salamii]
MAYLKPPNCSITELSAPLPLSCDIWQAATAVAWREKMLSYDMSSDHTPSWSSIAQKPSLLDVLPAYYDKPLIALVVMHGFWSQVWAYQESQRFFRANDHISIQATTTLWLSCQHEDLAKRIENAQKSLSGQIPDPSHVQVIAEFCTMSLNVSPLALQQFAGRLGEEEAATTHPVLRQWMAGSEFKTAVWHAGQIFQIARKAYGAQLREFSAVAVYQASLTMWAYGLLSMTTGHNGSLQSGTAIENEGACQVRLDGPNNADTTAFVMFGRGVPGISVGPNRIFSPLTDIRATMTAGCDIYRANFSPGTETFPPLLEGMMNLMSDLGNIDTASL